jgi:hypothetical protein
MRPKAVSSSIRRSAAIGNNVAAFAAQARDQRVLGGQDPEQGFKMGSAIPTGGSSSILVDQRMLFLMGVVEALNLPPGFPLEI